MDKITLIEDHPAIIADQLLNNEIDIGLIPVAMIPTLKEAYIVTNYCIGTNNDVASVAIFSDVPMDQIEKILLDYQSRTSVQLARILLKEYWKKGVILEDASDDFCKEIKGTTAGVVIGDRALEQIKLSKYTFDLGAAWKAMTGLPFVFAAWVANKKLDDDFLEAFNSANAYGINHLEEVLQSVSFENYDLKTYYTYNLSYALTNEKRKGLDLFLHKLNQLEAR